MLVKLSHKVERMSRLDTDN